MRFSFCLICALLLASCAKEPKVIEVKEEIPHKYLIAYQQEINHGNNYVYNYIQTKADTKPKEKLPTKKGTKVNIILV